MKQINKLTRKVQREIKITKFLNKKKPNYMREYSAVSDSIDLTNIIEIASPVRPSRDSFTSHNDPLIFLLCQLNINSKFVKLSIK